MQPNQEQTLSEYACALSRSRVIILHFVLSPYSSFLLLLLLLLSHGSPPPQSRDQGDGIFPVRYAESIASRAVATSNSQPDERRTKAFKPISRPRMVYDGSKAREANRSGLRRQLRFMSTIDCQMHPGSVADMLPYLKFFEGGAPGSRPPPADGFGLLLDADDPGGPNAAAAAAAATKAILDADDIEEF